MPDFEPLFELKENLYKESCPVLLQSGRLYCAEPQEEEGEPRYFARLTFRNIDSRAVTALFVDLHVFDKANNETEVIRGHRYLVPVAGRDETFGEDVELPVGPSAKSFAVAVKRVEFEGEDVWTGSASLMYEYLPERKTMETVLKDSKLLAQYRRDFRDTMAQAGRGEALYVPERYSDLWFCTCGGINREGEENCCVCGAAYELQASLCGDIETLTEHLEAFEKAKAEKAEQERLEAERIAEEERLAAEERVRRRKRNVKIFFSVSIPLLILIAIFVAVLLTYLIPKSHYDEAAAMLENGQYDDAVAAFAALEDFGDSADRITEAKYRKALALMEEEKFEEAIAAFEIVIDYEDAEDRIIEANYRIALRTLENGDYPAALEQLTMLGDYKECEENIQLCWFNMAMQAVEKDDLDTAKSHYRKISDAQKEALQSAYCDKGIEFYEAGEEARAMEYFALVSYKSLLPKIDAVYYEQAVKLMEAEEYDAAEGIFTKLEKYEDSPEQIKKIHYIRAEAARVNGDYETALAEYALAGEDYEDVKRKVRDVSYTYGVQLLNRGRVVDSYEVLYPIRTYYPAYELLVTNLQYYTYVYDMNIGPNPDFENIEHLLEFE